MPGRSGSRKLFAALVTRQAVKISLRPAAQGFGGVGFRRLAVPCGVTAGRGRSSSECKATDEEDRDVLDNLTQEDLTQGNRALGDLANPRRPLRQEAAVTAILRHLGETHALLRDFGASGSVDNVVDQAADRGPRGIVSEI